MNTVRMNITIPKDVAGVLAGVKNKSAYIAEAIREKKKNEERQRLRKELEAAYKESAKEDSLEYAELE